MHETVRRWLAWGLSAAVLAVLVHILIRIGDVLLLTLGAVVLAVFIGALLRVLATGVLRSLPPPATPTDRRRHRPPPIQ
jgi:hypothetical protein